MSDAVNHPSHYAEGRKYEPKDVIRDWGLNFNLGNAVKYISRAGKKDDIVQDLKKAKQYLEFEIEAIEAERKGTRPVYDEDVNEEEKKPHNLCDSCAKAPRTKCEALILDLETPIPTCSSYVPAGTIGEDSENVNREAKAGSKNLCDSCIYRNGIKCPSFGDDAELSGEGVADCKRYKELNDDLSVADILGALFGIWE